LAATGHRPAGPRAALLAAPWTAPGAGLSWWSQSPLVRPLATCSRPLGRLVVRGRRARPRLEEWSGADESRQRRVKGRGGSRRAEAAGRSGSRKAARARSLPWPLDGPIVRLLCFRATWLNEESENAPMTDALSCLEDCFHLCSSFHSGFKSEMIFERLDLWIELPTKSQVISLLWLLQLCQTCS